MREYKKQQRAAAKEGKKFQKKSNGLPDRRTTRHLKGGKNQKNQKFKKIATFHAFTPLSFPCEDERECNTSPTCLPFPFPVSPSPSDPSPSICPFPFPSQQTNIPFPTLPSFPLSSLLEPSVLPATSLSEKEKDNGPFFNFLNQDDEKKDEAKDEKNSFFSDLLNEVDQIYEKEMSEENESGTSESERRENGIGHSLKRISIESLIN
jgi:hypothetical protein